MCFVHNLRRSEDVSLLGRMLPVVEQNPCTAGDLRLTSRKNLVFAVLHLQSRVIFFREATNFP